MTFPGSLKLFSFHRMMVTLSAVTFLLQFGTARSQTYLVAGDFRLSGMLTGNFKESRLFKDWSDGLRLSTGLMVRGGMKFSDSNPVSLHYGVGIDFTGFKFFIRQKMNVAIPELAKSYPDVLIGNIDFSQLHLVIPTEISLRLFKPFWVFGILQFPGVSVTAGLENRFDIGTRNSRVTLYQLDAFGNYPDKEITNNSLASRVAHEYEGELKRFESAIIYGASVFWESDEFGFAAGMNLGTNLIKPARSLKSTNFVVPNLLFYFRLYRVM